MRSHLCVDSDDDKHVLILIVGENLEVTHCWIAA